jgi:broad specificity phosphatase PhoE
VKPKRIIILRHGQSTSNANGFAVVDPTPNFKVELTPLGVQQAQNAGQELQLIIENESIFFYNSPYLRAKQTFLEINQYFINNNSTTREDVRLRELDHSFNLNRDELRSELKLKDEFGDFYYRPLRAESLSDLFNRLDSFINSMFRAFEKSDFPQNVIIVSHSFTIRIFLMRWFHLTIEEFESLQRPKNCSKYIFELNEQNQYVLQSPLLNRKGNNLLHNQQL